MCSREKLNLILDRVRDESKRIYGDKLNKIFLFGSYATGENKEDSDIDIMIILNCSKDEAEGLREKTYEMADDISIDEEVFVSILLRDKNSFEQNQSILPFYRNIVSTGIAVYGESEN